MGTFLFLYRPAADAKPDPDVQARWLAWFEELGSAVTDMGNPIFEQRSVGETGAGTRLGGYSFITAADLDAAVALAHGCPALADGGGVEVGEITFLDPDLTAGRTEAISAG
jgi:hypothetical protein